MFCLRLALNIHSYIEFTNQQVMRYWRQLTRVEDNMHFVRALYKNVAFGLTVSRNDFVLESNKMHVAVNSSK